MKRLGFRFPLFYGQALAGKIQAFSVAPLTDYDVNKEPFEISDFVRQQIVAESIAYHVSMELELMPEALDRDLPDHDAAFKRWEIRAELLSRRIRNAADSFRPDGIVCFQGYYLEAAILRELAHQQGLYQLAWENACYKDYLVWDNVEAVTFKSDLPLSVAKNHKASINITEARAAVESLFSNLKETKTAEHQSPAKSMEPFEDGKPILLYIGQVYTDSSVVFGRNGFFDPVELMEHLYEVSRQEGYQLIVKLHPKEKMGANPLGQEYRQLTWRKFQKSKELFEAYKQGELRCDTNNEYDTYSLIESADVVVTLNSQAGLEAGAMGRPVVVCGHSFYHGYGFTEAAHSPGDLKAAISTARMNWGSGRHDKACMFLYSYLNHYCVRREEKRILRACYRLNGLKE